jgi:DNA-binding beta-propeller fold protein YncE
VRLAATWAAYQLAYPVAGAAAIVRDGQILLAGGTSAGRQLRSVTRLAPRTGQQQPAGSLPVPVSDAAAAIVQDRLTVFGGSGARSASLVQAAAPAGNAGHANLTRASATLPSARAGLVAVTASGRTYLIGGGTPGHPQAAVLVTTDGVGFAAAARLPVPVSYAAAVARAGQLWIAGGVTSTGPTNVIQRVDLRTGRAKVAGHLPRPLAAASMFVLDGTIVLAGGSTATTGGPGSRRLTSDSVLTIDPGTGAVRSAGSLPAPVAHAASAVVGGTAYLIGGTDGTRAVPAVTAVRVPSASAERPPMPWLAPAAGRGHLAPGSDPTALPADVLVADHLNNRLVIIDPQGRVRWVFPRPGDLRPGQTFRVPDDAFFSPDGQYIIATQEDDQLISVISVAASRIVYRYGKAGTPGTGPDRLDNPDDALVLPGGDILAADIKNCRIIVIDPPAHRPARVIGRPGGWCAHQPPQSFGSPNGAFPMTNGGYVVTEINGDWADGLGLTGRVQWSAHPPGVLYPSDTNEVYPGCYLTVDYSDPGQVVEFTPGGRLLWRRGGLNKPSLAIPMPNGDILLNDDFNHRVVVIDPADNRIVWQYGHTGVAGRAPGYLNDPDGLDLVPPDSLLIRHAATAGRP